MMSIRSGKEVNIVISRYDEQLNWINPYLQNCIIYNKGKDDISYPYIKLPNLGRENHTWVYHILNNYDSLPEYLIFLQGSPHYHFMGNVERFLERFLDKENRIKMQVEDLEYIPLTDWYTTEEIKYTEFEDAYIKLFGIQPPFKKIEYATCGQFCVSSNRIRKYSKNFYEKFFSLFETKEYKKGDEESFTFAYTAERMWTILYSQKYLK